ncbi:symplekin [Ostrinia nubilalis]|uniref:symplekin n=1 Tax=Ostrinia nubilalis TaxID=29057 RepID=UPI0030826605
MSSKFHQAANVTAQNQLVQWINEAGMSEGGKKTALLRKIIELLLHSASQMIPVYMENILSYVNDKSTDVKKQVITFIEEMSKLHPEYLPKVIGQLRLLVADTVIAVQKRAIQAASIVYRNTLLWICKTDAEMSEMQYVWDNLTQLKLMVLNMIDSDNEGIRTHSIKFLEEVVLLQSPGEGTEDDFSLESFPATLPFINRKAIEEESEHIFDLLVKFHNSQHISSVNLMACMTTLCLLAKFRPKYMPRVIQALGDLHTTLPPTLSQSQVNSVRKHLKMLLINIIKHPSSNEMMPQLTQLLVDIGMTTQEINKVIPKERRNKRVGELKSGEIPSKRFRVDSPQSVSQGSDSNSNSRSDFNMFEEDSSQGAQKPAVTEDTIYEGLNNVENVVNLVTTTLVNQLPVDMPSNFVTAYKPIPNSGSKVQKKHLAKMMLALIKDEAVIPVPPPSQPTLSDLAAKIPLLRDDDEKTTLKNAVAKLQESTKADRQMESAVSKLMEETRQEHLKEEERKAKEKEKPVPPPTPSVPKLKQKVKLLKLQEITRPIPKEIKERLMIQAVNRILHAEKESAIGGAAQIRAKFITIFASSYTPEIRELVLNYILEDPANRIELALSWLYEEYAFMQGFNRHPVTLQPKLHEKHDQNYNQLLCALITQISERGDPTMENSKDVLLRKIYAEAPVITSEAVDYLKHLVSEDKVAFLALEILEELCIMRPPRSHKFMNSLVCHVLNENIEIRDATLKSVVKIYQCGTEAAKKVIEKHALLYLGFISLSSPPPELVSARHHGLRVPWNDEMVKVCLSLVMALFPYNEELIIEVARVYGCAGSEAKRVVLRVVEGPVRAALATPNPDGGDSALRPAFRDLLDECPRGAETLLTRLVHIFTEKSAPSAELVSRVRELYATRVSDVRFLIPVLTGLSKKEILAALPKLIKLNPVVVKEVFNKLLGLQNPNEESPVDPVELMIALHLIDPSKADLKYIIKATALCFGEKQTYTQDVLSAVLQRLAEENEIPVLMMRSVLQALTLYPALAPLVLNILQLLVEKEVWLNKVAWEGWVKCCERLLPQACFLLVSLPARALQAASPALLAALRAHAAGLSPAERALLPPHVARLERASSSMLRQACFLLVSLPARALQAASPALLAALRAHAAGLSPAERALLPPHVARLEVNTIMCCERLLPQACFHKRASSSMLPQACFLLVSLPARALQTASPALLAALRAHAAGLSPAERALLPPHVARLERASSSMLPQACFLLVSLPARALQAASPALLTALRAHAAGLSPAERALLPPHVARLERASSSMLPQACFLLVSLPARALQAASPALLAALRAHAAGLSPAERALLPPHVARLECL